MAGIPANDLNIQIGGYVVFDGVSVFTGRTFQSGAGITLSNASGIAGNTTITASGSVPLSFNGNSGTATPALNVLNVVTANSTVQFVGSGSTLTQDFGLSNLLIGVSGSSITTGAQNVSLGAFNTALTSGSFNVSIGNGAGQLLSTGSRNTFVGEVAGNSITTGDFNILIGQSAGSSLSSGDSSNIYIGHAAGGSNSNTIRIGVQGSGSGQQNQCFVAGITGVTTSNSQLVTIDTTTGQLGASASSPMAYTNVNFAASPYTVLASDQYISVDSSGGAISLLFPNAPTATRRWVVKDRTGNAAANNITVTTVGGTVTIDGSTSYVIATNYGSIQMLANATPTYEVF